jgi:hypothetical protein
MTDIVERLRKQMMLSDLQSGLQPHYVCHVAADEIERLREALRYYAKNHYPNVNDGPWGVNSTDFGDVARAALGEDK